MSQYEKKDAREESSDRYSLRGKVFHQLREDILSGHYKEHEELREMAISNTLWDIPLHFTVDLPEAASPFSAFILLGFLSALLQWSRQRVSAYFRKKEEETT